MDTLADMIDRREPLAAECLCEDALTRFIREPQAMALAVVEHGKPVGVVGRDSFLARMEAPGAGQKPVRDFMDGAPVIMLADEPAEDAARRIMAETPQALLSGFLVTDEAGGFVGVGTAVCLLAGFLDRVPAPDAIGIVDRMAAEVREPLIGALSITEQLRKLRLPEGAGAYLDTIAEAHASVLGVLDTASDLSRASCGDLALAPEARRLQDLMDEVEGRWRQRAENAGITLLVSYDGAPDCMAQVDAQRLLQVFDALIGHALENVRHGVVEASLRTRPTENGVAVSGRVRDNGARYTAEHLSGLFAMTPSGDLPAGMSLALAAHTVEALGGQIAAEANVGDGATITFEATLAVGGPEFGASSTAQAQTSRSAHILVVDDNATNRMVVEALCEMFDCSTESVVDGVDAVEAAKAGRFDVILMDIKMPRMDGVTATREIRKLRGANGRTPIIALTANADPDDVFQYLAAGMQSVVEKPIKPERLMEALDEALTTSPNAKSAAAA